jgi:hypothetical protein
VRRWMSILLFCGMFPGAAAAQTMTVQIGPPAIRWEARPPRVLIAPGVWVVEDYDDEVFYEGGWYWVQRDDHWYRSRDHRGHWGEIGRDRVPARFFGQAPGYYRHYRPEARPQPAEVRRGSAPPRRAERDRPDNRRGKPGRGNDKQGRGQGRPR